MAADSPNADRPNIEPAAAGLILLGGGLCIVATALVYFPVALFMFGAALLAAGVKLARD